MKRKVLSVMLATAMTATLFAGCGSDASNADSANSADATASTTEAGDAKTDAAASGSGSVYYLNLNRNRISSGRIWQQNTQQRPEQRLQLSRLQMVHMSRH